MPYSFCKDVIGEGLNLISDGEKDLRRGEAIDGIQSIIGIPYNVAPEIRKKLKGLVKPGERKRLEKQVARERLRYEEHQALFDYLLDDMLQHFEDSLYLIEPRIRMKYIEGMIGIATHDTKLIGPMERKKTQQILQRYMDYLRLIFTDPHKECYSSTNRWCRLTSQWFLRQMLIYKLFLPRSRHRHICPWSNGKRHIKMKKSILSMTN